MFFTFLVYIFSYFIVINAQIGINTENPTEALDINGNVRVRTPVNIESLADPSDYTNVLRLNSAGVLGYAKERKPVSGYTFYDVYSHEMPAPVTSILANASLPLNVSIEVEIPPHSAAIFFIDYNIPISVDRVKSSPVEDLNTSYVGITLFKTGGVELQEGSRKFTLFRPASADAAAVGMPVLGKSVQKMENPTGSTLTISFYLNGYIETNPSNIPIRFGMYSATGQNYNWGKGLMTIMSYVKDLES